MKMFKKISAMALALLMLLSFAGCHKKGEIAVTVNGYKFTSAYYMCALIDADQQARSKVDEKKSDDKKDSETASGTEAKETDYFKEKIDGKAYETWVKDTAIEKLTKIAAFKTKCKEAKLKVSDSDKSSLDYYADYYWSYYGYQQLYEENGVSKETYKEFTADTYYENLYFEHVYGEGGDKEISAEDVKKTMLENYQVADVLTVDMSSMEDEEKAEKKTAFEGYAEALKNGSKTFEEIYLEQNPDSQNNNQTSEDGPKDTYAQILGSKDTDYASDNYDTVKDMAVGEVKYIVADGETSLTILVKKNIEEDEYYLKTLDISIRHQLKDEEYNKDMDKFAKTLKADVKASAIKPFKVKKIKYPEQTA